MTARPYTELPGLEHVYLEDSFVLDIVARPRTVRFSLDLVLTPEHPLYKPPPPTDQHCYRRAGLQFGSVSELVWFHGDHPPATDATGELDWGAIHSFVHDGDRHYLEGDWGRMEVVSEDVQLRFDD